MAKVYFISINYLKENTTIDTNIEDKMLRQSITDAQNIDIQAITGSRLYEKLKEKITGSTMAGIYKTLMDDYIEKTLLKFAERRCLIYLYAKIKNKSVVTQDSEYSTPVEIEILNKLRSEILNDAEFYSNRLKLYLEENKANIVEYKTPNPDALDHYMNPDKTDSFFCGIHLSSDNDCGGRGLNDA